MTDDLADPDRTPEEGVAADASAVAVPGEEVAGTGVDESEVVEDRRYPSTVGGAFYLAILVAAGTGIGIVMLAHEWRVGIRVISGALGTAGVIRLLLPQRDAGMLAVRHRFVDVALLVSVALALYFLAGDIPDQPA